jgi:hypothetical protein
VDDCRIFGVFNMDQKQYVLPILMTSGRDLVDPISNAKGNSHFRILSVAAIFDLFLAPKWSSINDNYKPFTVP